MRNCASSQSDKRGNSFWNLRCNFAQNYMTPMPIHYGKSHKVGVNINFELSVTQVNLAINALYILYAHKLSWVTTKFAISSLRSLPSKLFNSLPKKKTLKWVCWRPQVRSIGNRNHTQCPKTWFSFLSLLSSSFHFDFFLTDMFLR